MERYWTFERALRSAVDNAVHVVAGRRMQYAVEHAGVLLNRELNEDEHGLLEQELLVLEIMDR